MKKNKVTKKKKIILSVILTVLLLPIVILGIIIYTKGYSHNTERIAQLKSLDGVTDVKAVFNINMHVFAEKYMVTFEQPLDWNDPSKGTFPQRVEVSINRNPRINVMETNGYCLNDKLSKFAFLMASVQETVYLFDGNYINVEQRFFGDSRPSDMSNESTEYWEYLTSENSANDYHKIYTELSSVLGEKWIAQGTSRGGLMCNTFGYYFPDDMSVYLAYVAPCSEGLDEDKRFYDFVYNEIEDEIAVLLLRIAFLFLADGEGNGAPVVNSAHEIVGAQHFHFGHDTPFGIEVLFDVLKGVNDIVAGGDAVGPVLPGHFQQTVAVGNAVDMYFVVPSVVPPAAVGVHRDANLVGVLDDKGPQALFRPPVLEGRIGTCRILHKLFFGGEEVFLGNLGIDLFVKIGAGAQSGHAQNHIQNFFHTVSV